MRWPHLPAACLLLATLTLSARAGFLFKKAPKPKPEERVPELIVTVKTDADEHKRAAAAAELRQYDPKAFPEIVPILADVLKNDAKPGVRAEAASSLSRIRPVSVEAGMALEQAAGHDANLRVRMQCKTSLMHYHMAGYRTPKNLEGPADPGTDKKGPPLTPLAPPKKKGEPVAPVPAKGKPQAPVAPPPSTAEPPLASPITDPSLAQPLPVGPTRQPVAPGQPPTLDPPAAAPDQGPALTPPAKL